MLIRDCREVERRSATLDIPNIVAISSRAHLSPPNPRARSRIAMAQQVGGAVALDAPASSVSYRCTTPWKEPLKEKRKRRPFVFGNAFNKERKRKRKRKKKGKDRKIENNVETSEVWESENDCMRCK